MIILTLSRFIDSMTKGSSSWCAVCCVVLKGVVLGGFWSECNQVSWSLSETKCSKPVGCMNNQESAEKQQQQQPTNQPKKQTKAKTSKLKHLKGSRRLHPALTSLHTHTWHFSLFTHTYNNQPLILTLPSCLGIPETIYHLFYLSALLHSAEDKWTIY